MSTIIDCKTVAAHLKAKAKTAITHPLKLVILTTPFADAPSRIYMRNKMRACAEVGIAAEVIEATSQSELLSAIDKYNNITGGVIIQLPLPNFFNTFAAIERLNPLVDVDNLTGRAPVNPCTPMGIINLLQYYNYNLDGSLCTVIGRSNIVGKPLTQLLLNNNATVTQCHSHTSPSQLLTICRNSDFIFTSAGVPGLITADHVSPHTTCIDISINRVDGHLCGDLAASAQNACAAYTPVPGGIGVLTVAQLVLNLAALDSIQNK